MMAIGGALREEEGGGRRQEGGGKQEGGGMEADQPQHMAPHGAEPYDQGGVDDLGAMSTDQQARLNEFKVKTRIDNERYLREHPELECLLSKFLREVVRHRPDNVRDFAADFFTSPDLPRMVERLLAERRQQGKMNEIIMKV